MKLCSWQEFIDDMIESSLEDDIILMIQNYEELQTNGYIGGCLLRETAQSWCSNINQPFLSSFMKDVAMECYKVLAKRYIRMYHV